MDSESDSYAWLVNPLDPRDFEGTYYEKKVCVVNRRSPRYYADLLSLTDLDRVLGTHAIHHPDLNIVQADRSTLTSSDYADKDGMVDPVRAARLFAEGATLVFSQLHWRVPSLGRLCTMLGRLFSSRMQTNIYLTPANAQGFPSHWDTHDVFVFQVSGSKRWTIYDTKITLPLRGQQFDPKLHSAGEPTLEFELQAGDWAYVPRGAMHSARSTHEPSLHVTTGLIGYTWADLFLQSVADAALADETLRENLPIGFARAAFPVAEKARLVREKLERVGAFLELNSPFPYFGGELLAQNRPCLTNLLRQISALGEVGPGSRVRRRPDAGWELQQTESHCIVRCYGNQIELPAFVAPALEFALRGATFRVQEIPDCLDEPGKLTLVRRLLKEGLLECHESGIDEDGTVAAQAMGTATAAR